MTYQVHIERGALKTVRSLDKATARRIHDRINELAIDPYDQRISGPLKMGAGERKFRMGDWRIIYEVDQASHTINVIAIRPRKRAYPKQ
jgi:mRNA interferase RelE/StbE